MENNRNLMEIINRELAILEQSTKKKGEFVSRNVRFEEIKPHDVGKLFNTPFYTEFSVYEKLTERTTAMLSCKRISKNEYIDGQSGEIKGYNSSLTKSEESFKNNHKIVPKIIQGYFRGSDNERHIIFKYDTPKYNPESISDDMKEFFKKLKRICHNFIYLYGKEPYKDGSWHIHCIIKIWGEIDFNVSLEKITKMWKKGNVYMERIINIDKFAWRFNILNYNSKKDRLKYYPSNIHPFVYSKEIKIERKRIEYGQINGYVKDKKLKYRNQKLLGYENNTNGLNPVGIVKYEQYKK